MTTEELRDSLLPQVQAYAQREGLSELGTIQAALRFGIEAGKRDHEALLEQKVSNLANALAEISDAVVLAPNVVVIRPTCDGEGAWECSNLREPGARLCAECQADETTMDNRPEAP